MKNSRSIGSLFPQIPLMAYMRKLQSEIKDCETVLDLGCGDETPLQFMKIKYTVGMDIYDPYLKKSKKNKLHDEYFKGDILKATSLFKEKQFDVCVALGVIEHQTKKNGLKLIAIMEQLAKKKIIFSTPNGFIHQHNEENSYQNHLSGWTAQEMKKLGFQVTGFYGIKGMRGEGHQLKHRPKIVFGAISELTNILYTKSHPEWASELLCVKSLSYNK